MDIPSDRPHERLQPRQMAPVSLPESDTGLLRYDGSEHSQDLAPTAEDAPLARTGSQAVAPWEQPARQVDRAVTAEVDRVPDPVLPPSPPIHQEIASAPRATLLGNSAGTRFLIRQGLITEAAALADEPQPPDPQQRTTKLVVAVNCSPRAPDARDNLNLDPSRVRVVDAGVFTPGGLVENLPPKHSAAVLAAATAGSDREARAAHTDVLRSVTPALTERVIDGVTGRPGVKYPDLVQVADGVGVWDDARIDTEPLEGRPPEPPFPEHPSSLSDSQIKRVQHVANTDRIEVSKTHVTQLRSRLQWDVLDGGEAASQQESPQGSLFPSKGSDVPPVQVTRTGVGQHSYEAQLDAEVRAAAVGALAIAAGTPQGTPWRLVVEHADEIVIRCPEVLKQIEAVCENQNPRVPLTLTFGGAATPEQIAPFVRGKTVVVGSLEPQPAEAIGKVLPSAPVVEITSVANNKGANDGINQGQNQNKGHDPDKSKANSGTGSSSGTAEGVSYGFAQTQQVTVRPPRGHELTQKVGEWRAVLYYPDGTFVGEYDLQDRGIKVGDESPTAQPAAYDARQDIDRIERDQARRRGQPVPPEPAAATEALEGNSQTTLALPPGSGQDSTLPALPPQPVSAKTAKGNGMPALPPQPKPLAGTFRDTDILKLTPSQQVRELVQTKGGRNRFGGLTPEFLKGAVVDVWLQQTPSETLANPEAAKEALYDWGQRASLSQSDIRTMWRGYWRRIKDAQEEG